MFVAKTFDDLKKLTNAYDDFAKVDDCPIPDYYKTIFPKHCECGAEMIMTKDNLTQLQCCDPTCPIKTGYRLAYFISSLGYKGFGEQSALDLVAKTFDKFEYCSFLYVFLLEDDVLREVMTRDRYYTFINIKKDLATATIPLIDIIAALGIQNVGKRSRLFSGIRDIRTLVGYVLADRIDELCDYVGIYSDITRFALNNSRMDIALVSRIIPNIMNIPDKEVFLAITGKVSVNGVSYTRHEFVALCESIKDENGEQMYKITETKAQSKLQYVVADEPSNSDKYNIGERMGILITADDLYTLLLENATSVEEASKPKDEETSGGEQKRHDNKEETEAS